MRGSFTVRLAPGRYHFTARNVGGYRSRTTRTVTVPTSEPVELTIDSGLRLRHRMPHPRGSNPWATAHRIRRHQHVRPERGRRCDHGHRRRRLRRARPSIALAHLKPSPMTAPGSVESTEPGAVPMAPRCSGPWVAVRNCGDVRVAGRRRMSRRRRAAGSGTAPVRSR